MDKRREDKLTSFKALIDWMKSYQELLNGFSILNEKASEFKAAVNTILSKLDIIIAASKGSGDKKQKLKDTMVTKVIPIAAALHHYSASIEDAETAAFSRVTPTLLKSETRDTELAVLCKKITRKAILLSAELSGYKITPVKLAQADNAVEEYDDFIGKKEASIEVRKTAGKEMNAAFKKADFILKNDLDVLIEIIAQENQTAYSEYKGSRQIKSTGVRHKKKTDGN